MARLRQRLGRTIRALRETNLDVSQETFANSIRMDPSFEGEVERAQTNWSIDTLELPGGAGTVDGSVAGGKRCAGGLRINLRPEA